MQSHVVRSTFLHYFRNKGHNIVPSSSLVPADDPTLLFVNSGMVQFKDVFLGTRTLDYATAATAQRCVRAGGKHNDLENVGYTARHHTFFEMLGNFSFGAYFKRQAIEYAWEFVTKVLKLPEERLWITIYHDDKESESIWLDDIKVSPERFSRLNQSNFWQMGETGPCGPCSEIFYDHGPEVAGGPPGTPEEDGDRYIEIWNLVFMQYKRDANGNLTALQHPSIDTGMGLERISAVMQGVVSNYATDLFIPLVNAACQATGCIRKNEPSVQVIADHLRSSCFLLLDGVTPSNEGRGYVLRRIIRRAIRHGFSLGCSDAFFHQLTPVLVEVMRKAEPTLARNQVRIEQAIRHEEMQFRQTLSNGMLELEKAIAGIKGTTLPGDLLFRLYDTFGFPVDMVGDIARERSLTLDMEGFEHEMARQRAQSRHKAEFVAPKFDVNLSGSTQFVGYYDHSAQTHVQHLLRISHNAKEVVDSLHSGDKGVVVLDKTPFYAQSGGQVGDTGVLECDDGVFEVEETHKLGDHFWHIGFMRDGHCRNGDTVAAAINVDQRRAIMRNHSATHLLHAALRSVLGDGVMQRGSLVDHERLRFDFSHTKPVTQAQINTITQMVNQQIRFDTPVTVEQTSMDEAVRQGALAFFEDKYGDSVRVLRMGTQPADQQLATNDMPFSIELCGGTHVARTGEIGMFVIVHETGVASGVRRVEALTGDAAVQWMLHHSNLITELATSLKTPISELVPTVVNLRQQLAACQKTIASLEARVASAAQSELTPEQLGAFQALVRRIDGTSPTVLRQLVDVHIARLGPQGVVVFAGGFHGKVVLVAGVSGEAKHQIHAGNMLATLATVVDGKAGGKPTFAQGGGTNVANIDVLLQHARTAIAATTS